MIKFMRSVSEKFLLNYEEDNDWIKNIISSTVVFTVLMCVDYKKEEQEKVIPCTIPDFLK